MKSVLHVYDKNDDNSDVFYQDTDSGMRLAEYEFDQIAARGGNPRLWRESDDDSTEPELLEWQDQE